MMLSEQFVDLLLKQLESFGSSSGVTHLVVYMAAANKSSDAGFELVSQWPNSNKSLLPIEEDPELKVSSPNRRWYPLQEKNILIGVLRVEANFKNGEWPELIDNRLKALASSLGKCFAIEIDRQKKDDEINFLQNQVGVIVHQLRNPLAALKTYAKLLMKRLGSDQDAIALIESMITEQNQINAYVSSFDQINKPIRQFSEIGDERLLLPPNIENKKKIIIHDLLIPILERGKANAKLQNRNWTQPTNWPKWTHERVSSRFAVISEIIANLLENAFKYSDQNSGIGIISSDSGFYIFDQGQKISNQEREKIFQKGYRGSASHETDGSGVGLFLARKLARQFGGELELIDNSFENKLISSKESNIFHLKVPIEQLHE
tara:strand:+ start:1269 stop:2396 length:1128 start_codon:yes stop_codon:yes gene_type:complete